LAESAASDATAKLNERKLLDRAKGLLMDTHGLAEADAFRFLRSSAMNGRSSMGEVAQKVIDGELQP
ncbi:MAG: ANTAR domain-containing response regulator, partial [Acidimicrobiia bacterium]